MNVGALTISSKGRSHKWRLYPIGDLHADTLLFNEEKFRRYAKQIRDDPQGVWVSVGDYIDGTTPMHRHFNPSSIRPEILLSMEQYDLAAHDLVVELMSLLPADRGAMMCGNHDERREWSGFSEGVARALKRGNKKGPVYLGYEGLLRVSIREEEGKSRANTRQCVVHAQHGAGGGMKPGSKVNRLQDTTLATAEADVYIAGHVEDGDARILPLYTVTKTGKPRLQKHYKAWVRAAGFYGNRIEGVNTYVARAGYPSVDEGTFYLEIWDGILEGISTGQLMKRIEFV